MNVVQILKLIRKNFLLLFLLPLLVAVAVYYFLGNKPKEYVSSAMIFTSSTSKTTAGDEAKIDFFTYNNLFDNILLLLKSRENIEETSLLLLAQHIYTEYSDSTIVTNGSIDELKNHINENLWAQLKDNASSDSTYANVVKYHRDGRNTPVHYLLKAHPNYSLSNISNKLTASRRATSNVLELIYSNNDPGICKNTLDFVIQNFSKRYRELKYNENLNSISYFQDQLLLAEDKLRNSEAELKEFITEFKILNYYEQGKYLDISKLEQEQDEERARRLSKGLESNITYLEGMFENFEQKVKNIDELKELQRQIINKNNELEALQLNKNSSRFQTERLEKEIENLRDAIDLKSQNVFSSSNSDKGIPRNNILSTWLDLNLEYEEQNVALDVMQNRSRYLDRKITEFAPLGAELKKLEREVSVNENQYLSILHGLNMAFLQKYDLETATHFKVIDRPYMPQTPVASRRAIMVLGSYVVVWGLIFSFLVIMVLFDLRIKTLVKGQKLTRMKAIASFPKIRKSSHTINQDILMNWISKIAKNTVVSILNSKIPQNDYLFVTINSIKKNEGKSFITKLIAESINSNYRRIALLTQDPASLVISKEKFPNIDIYRYKTDEHFTTYSKVEDIVDNPSQYDCIMMELPSILSEPIAVKLINNCDYSIFVLSVDRIWTLADSKAINLLSQTTNAEMGLILNRMENDDLVQVYGPLPYKRNYIWNSKKEIVSA